MTDIVLQYNFDSSSGAYTFASPAQIDQFSGEPIPAAFSLLEPPLPAEPGQTNVAVDGNWVLKQDQRGNFWDKETGNPEFYADFGPLPAHLTKIPKPDANHVWQNGGWVADLEKLKLEKIKEISSAFTSAVLSGFSTGLGLKMNADISDVQRLKSAYDLATLTGQTALPIVVDYDNIGHENIALTDVLSMVLELGVHYQTLYAKKNSLRMQAMAAVTQADLDAVVW